MNKAGEKSGYKKISPVQIPTQLDVLRPAAEPSFPIPISLWNRFMDRLQKCSHTPNFYESAGWSATTSGASAVVSGIAFWFSVQFSDDKAIFWGAVMTQAVIIVGGIAAIVVGLITLRYAKEHAKQSNDLQQIILDDMRYFAGKHIRIADPGPEEPASVV